MEDVSTVGDEREAIRLGALAKSWRGPAGPVHAVCGPLPPGVDAVGPATGGIVSVLAIISGTWFPVTHGFLHDVGQFLPLLLGSSEPAASRSMATRGAGWVGLSSWPGR